MYSTVIDRHPTIIKHQIPQPRTITAHPDALKSFNINPADSLADKLRNSQPVGEFSIPLRLESGAINDPTLSDYETPNFIHKNENILNNHLIPISDNPLGVNPEVFLKSNFQRDINTVLANLDHTKDKAQKISVCNKLIRILIFKISFPH